MLVLMKTLTKVFLAGCWLLLCASIGVSSLYAVTSSFETTDGAYVNGSTIAAKTDTSIGAAWSSVTNVASSTANVYDGALALRLTDASSSASSGATISWTNADSLLLSPFTFQFSMAVGADVSTGTSRQVQVYLGQASAGDFNHWAAVVYDDGILRLSTGTGVSGSDYGVNLGNYTTYSPLGSYVTFSITIDPTTHKYTNVSIDGTLTANPVDLTTTVLASNGGTIPWTSASGNPPNQMLIITGGNDTVTADFDAFSINAVPEPGTWALVVMALASLLFVSRRRASRA